MMRPAMKSTAFTILAALALCCAGGAASAQSGGKNDKLRLGVFGSGKGSGPLLTKAELKECLALQQRIAGDNDASLKERDGIERDKAEIARVSDELKTERGTVDLTQQEQVDRYNDKLRARDGLVKAWEGRVATFNQRVEAMKTDRDGWAQRCDGRRYDQVDEEELRKGR